MDEKELRIFLQAMDKLRAANTASPEKARKFLEDEGYLDKDGNIAEPYSAIRRHL